MTTWHEVHDSRKERPEELDTTSSTTTVYERRNIRQETVEPAADGQKAVTEWVYEQREYTAEEYAELHSPAIQNIMQAVSGLELAVAELGLGGLSV